MTHTPTPWTYDGDNTIYSEQNNTSVCTVEQFCANAGEGQSMTEEEMQANAERIVECVNACEGIEDPKAFIELAKSMVDTILTKNTSSPMSFKQTVRIDELYVLESGVNEKNELFFDLVKTHFKHTNTLKQEVVVANDERYCVKSFSTKPTQEELAHEIMLNDWSRWNTELPFGQYVEINEATYDYLLDALPPRIRYGSYFEVGEPHHHEDGHPIHRACWKKDGKYYTGRPTVKDFV